MQTQQPKVLVLDVETAPMTAYIWSLKDQFVAANQIRSDWYILAWCAKWLGEPASKAHYMDQRSARRIENDKEILKPLWKLLDEADIVITQNGKNFDGPKLNARFILNGMKPPTPYRHWDTYQLVRRVAKFTSNSLDYLTDKLCVKYKKLHHTKFPGMALWRECLAGNRKAWEEMKRYNIHDVLATEELYNKIKAWAPETMPNIHGKPNSTEECHSCGHKGIGKNGTIIRNTGRYQRFLCGSCGRCQKGAKINLANR